LLLLLNERWRLIFLASRLRNGSILFPTPTHFSTQRPNFTGGRQFTFTDAIGDQPQAKLFLSTLLPPTTVGEAISDLPAIKSGEGEPEMDYDSPPRSEYQRRLRVGATRLYNHECSGVAPINLKRVRYVKPGGSWRDIPHDLLPKGLQRARRSELTPEGWQVKWMMTNEAAQESRCRFLGGTKATSCQST
jgi:DNA (cytosine-5)-methyltransferase 1